jgi:hypothetical protein
VDGDLIRLQFGEQATRVRIDDDEWGVVKEASHRQTGSTILRVFHPIPVVLQIRDHLPQDHPGIALRGGFRRLALLGPAGAELREHLLQPSRRAPRIQARYPSRASSADSWTASAMQITIETVIRPPRPDQLAGPPAIVRDITSILYIS